MPCAWISLHQRELGWAAVEASASRNLAFLGEAFVPAAGRFRNFRAVDGTWLDDGGSEDCQGRALHALGETILLAPDAAHGRDAPACSSDAPCRQRAS